MAAGLGTRMRSATPKHLHPLLGRRMVDWVIAAARATGADPIVVVASPRHARRFDGVEVAVQEQPLGTGDAVAPRARRSTASSGDVLVLSGDTPLLTAGRCCASSLDTHRREQARPRPSSRSSRPTPRQYGRIVRDGNGRLARIVEARDAMPTSSCELREVNSSIYVFAAEKLWRGARAARPQNAQGELYLTDSIAHPRRRAASASRARRRRPGRGRRESTRASELAAAAAALRDRINEAHMLAGVTIVDPQSTWIDGGVEIEPDVDDPSVHRAPRDDDGRRGRRDRPARRRGRRVIGDRCRSAVLLPSPRHRPRRDAKAGDLRRGQELARSARGRRSRTSPTSATPRSGEDYEHRRRQHHRQLPARARAAEEPDARSGATSGPESTIRSLLPSRSATTRGLQPGRSSRKMSRPARLRGCAPRQDEQGWVYDKRGKRDD